MFNKLVMSGSADFVNRMVLVSVSLTVFLLLFVFTGLLSKLNHDLNLGDFSDFVQN